MNTILYRCQLMVALAIGSTATATGAATTANGSYYATPSWDQTLPSSTRFVVLTNFGDAAVLDRNTGLVWEKTPNNKVLPQLEAEKACSDSTLGGQGGWRLPAINELTSLLDATNTNPSLPTGHPFLGVHSAMDDLYWTSTTVGADLSKAWEVEFNGFLDIPGIFTGRVLVESKDLSRLVWCVRGGGPVTLY